MIFLALSEGCRMATEQSSAKLRAFLLPHSLGIKSGRSRTVFSIAVFRRNFRISS
jgi:hypothetical protein